MFKSIGAAVSLIVLLAAVWGGYKWGAHDLDIVKAQLAELRSTQATVKHSDAEFRQRLDQALAAQAKEHEVRLAELKQRDQADVADLQAAKAAAEQSAAVQRAQAAAAAARAEGLRKQLASMTTAGGADERARLQKALDDANAALVAANNAAAGQACLASPVPAEILKSLNRGAGV